MSTKVTSITYYRNAPINDCTQSWYNITLQRMMTPAFGNEESLTSVLHYR